MRNLTTSEHREDLDARTNPERNILYRIVESARSLGEYEIAPGFDIRQKIPLLSAIVYLFLC